MWFEVKDNESYGSSLYYVHFQSDLQVTLSYASAKILWHFAAAANDDDFVISARLIP